MSIVPAIVQLAESCTMKELEKLAHKFLNKVENEKMTTKETEMGRRIQKLFSK